MSKLLATIKIRCEYEPEEKDIRIESTSKGRTQMEIILKSKSFRNVSCSSGLLHAEP